MNTSSTCSTNVSEPSLATPRKARPAPADDRHTEMTILLHRRIGTCLRVMLLLFCATGPCAEDAGENVSAAPSSKFANRFRFLSAEGITHFRYIDTGPGRVAIRDACYKLSTRVQLNLKGDGSTFLQARGESGQNFIASYDYTGIGVHRVHWSFNLKSLFLGQKLGKNFELHAGGVEFDRGAGTEVTYADNDGWLAGRLPPGLLAARSSDRTRKGQLDRGLRRDFLQPNVFARFHRLSEQNYVQVLAAKKPGATRDLSVEFDSIQTIRFSGEALHWQKLPLRVVDEGFVEAMRSLLAVDREAQSCGRGLKVFRAPADESAWLVAAGSNYAIREGFARLRNAPCGRTR